MPRLYCRSDNRSSFLWKVALLNVLSWSKTLWLESIRLKSSIVICRPAVLFVFPNPYLIFKLSAEDDWLSLSPFSVLTDSIFLSLISFQFYFMAAIVLFGKNLFLLCSKNTLSPPYSDSFRSLSLLLSLIPWNSKDNLLDSIVLIDYKPVIVFSFKASTSFLIF